MIIGFTGTQKGMTKWQLDATKKELIILKPECTHHGDCIGADEQFDVICKELGIPVVIHPPSNPIKRAYCSSNAILEPKEYIERNHDIVDASDYLIATPFEKKEQLRSGTWATIRYARKKQKGMSILIENTSKFYPILN